MSSLFGDHWVRPPADDLPVDGDLPPPYQGIEPAMNCECFRAPCDCRGDYPGTTPPPIGIPPPQIPRGDIGFGGDGDGARKSGGSLFFWIVVGAAIYGISKSNRGN